MQPVSAKKIGEQIRRIRAERGLSQDDLGSALGLHRQSISLLEKGERELTAVELDTLARFLQVSYDDILAPEVKKPEGQLRTTGLRFEPEKLREMLLYLLELVGGRPNVGETVLYKLLYFCDFNQYEKCGKAITGMTYRRLQFGPVPQRNQFQQVIDAMVTQEELRTFEHAYFGKPQLRYIPLRDPDASMLREDERKTIEEVAAKLGFMNARQIEEYVHGDAPWEATDHQKPISYELVHWRTEPYALMTEEELDAAFEQAAAEDVEKHLEPMSAEEIAYYESLPDLSDDH